MGILFCALRKCRAIAFVPAARFLDDGFALSRGASLPLRLIAQRAVYGAEAVHILDFNLSPKFVRASGPDADIGVAAKVALLHIRAADADVAQYGLELRQVAARLVGATHIRLADNLHQRRAGAIDVQQAVRLAEIVAAVEKLSDVLFQMHASYANSLAALVGVYGEAAAKRERLVVLRNLVAFHQVGIGVILAIELGERGYIAAERKPCADNILHRLAVYHGHRAGHPHAHRAHRRVGRRVLIRRAARAKHLAFGQQLRMNL